MTALHYLDVPVRVYKDNVYKIIRFSSFSYAYDKALRSYQASIYQVL